MLPRTIARCLATTLLVACVSSACDEGSPTTPGGPAPEITRVDPEQVVPGSGPQIVAVSGQGFTPGLNVLLTPPNGSQITVSGDAIQAVQSVSFQVSATFDAPGDYLLAVRLLNGSESNAVRITAASPSGTAPRIDSVTPSAVQTGPAATVLTLTGVNFVAGSTVNLTTPAGSTSPLPTSAIIGVTATSMELSVVFTTAGSYAITVLTPQGQASNTATITAF